MPLLLSRLHPAPPGQFLKGIHYGLTRALALALQRTNIKVGDADARLVSEHMSVLKPIFLNEMIWVCAYYYDHDPGVIYMAWSV